MHDNQTIGIVGGGQLGRMLTLAALPLGFKVIVVDPTENCPAQQVGADQIRADLHDSKALLELGRRSDYITVEIEHLDTQPLQQIKNSGTPVNPFPKTIKLIQDKFKQKEFLRKNNLPVADFREIKNLEQAKKILIEFNGLMMLKTSKNAFDGRGNALIKNEKELTASLEKFKSNDLYAEKVLDFKKEIAVIVCKDTRENIKIFPVAETIHRRNICTEVLVPARISSKVEKKAANLASKTVKILGGAGVYAVEMFLLKDDSLVINEIAPRVHNSGHYTMNGCNTSQFEQHIRAITGLPFGDTALTSKAVCMINILGEKNQPTKIKGLKRFFNNSSVHLHFYGKSPTRIDRKMGHINVVGTSLKKAREHARIARNLIDV